MGRIAAEAADRLGWVDDPSFVVGGDLLARGSLVGQYSAAEEVVSAVGPIYSFTIVSGVIELLPIDTVGGLIDDPRLIEADSEGVVIDWRINCEHKG